MNTETPLSLPLIIRKKVWYDFTFWMWWLLACIPFLILLSDDFFPNNHSRLSNILRHAENRIDRNLMYAIGAGLIPVVALLLKGRYGKWIKNYSLTDVSGRLLGNISIGEQIVVTERERIMINDVHRIKIISNRYQNEQYGEFIAQTGVAFLQLEMKDHKLHQFYFLIPNFASLMHFQDILEYWYRMKIPISETHEKINKKTLLLNPYYSNEDIEQFRKRNNLP